MEEIRVKVNGGTLIATTTEAPNPVGFSILYETEQGDIIDVVGVEAIEDTENKDIKVYCYEDVLTDCFTGAYVLKHDEIQDALYG